MKHITFRISLCRSHTHIWLCIDISKDYATRWRLRWMSHTRLQQLSIECLKRDNTHSATSSSAFRLCLPALISLWARTHPVCYFIYLDLILWLFWEQANLNSRQISPLHQKCTRSNIKEMIRRNVNSAVGHKPNQNWCEKHTHAVDVLYTAIQLYSIHSLHTHMHT